jgi:hypothetical protein
LLSIFVPGILLGITACPGLVIDNIQVTLGPDGAIQGGVITFSCFSPVAQNIVSFEWEFGDGASGSGQTTTHVYEDYGTFSVTCRVVTIDSVFIFTKAIKINPFLTHLYWVGSLTNAVGRANLDGTGVNNTFIDVGRNLGGVAVNKTNIYWTNAQDGQIGIAELDGTIIDTSLITTGTAPFGIAIDDTYIYWANLADNAIGRAMLDGSNVDNSFITGLNTPNTLAVNDSHIFWVENFQNVGRANIDGTNVDPTFLPSVGFSVFGVELSATHIYVSIEGDNAIDRFDIDGANQVPDLFPGVNPSVFAFNEGIAYWGSLAIDQIWSANIDGTGLDTSFITTAVITLDLVVGPGE